MQTAHFDEGAAAEFGAPTGHDRFFRRSVKAARLLSIPASGVELPSSVELPTDRPVIFAANHTSMFDLVASLIALGHFGMTARIGVNARFFKSPGARQLLNGLGCIPFSREKRVSAEAAMVSALQDGQVCALMPEGRLIREHELDDGVGPGRPGVSRIARKAGAAVIPVGFRGSARAWPPGSPFMRMGWKRTPIRCTFGPPLLFESRDDDENVANLMSAIGRLVTAETPNLA